MSTRIISAYFDDIRKGKQNVSVVRQFLLDTYQRDPVKRGHLLAWLDQAQYEHPIPVTDFLLLRKEIETALNNYREPPVADDATVMVGAETLVADAGATVIAPSAPTLEATALTEATQANTAATIVANTQDATPLPERSDHAGLHNAATALQPSPADTVIQPAPPLPAPARTVDRRYLLWTALPLLTLALLGVVLISVWQSRPQPSNTPPAADMPTSEVTLPVRDPEPVAAQTEFTAVTGQPPAEALALTAPQSLFDLGEEALAQEVERRAAEDLFWPSTDRDTAYYALQVLAERFPGGSALLRAQVALKNAHLKASEAARNRGDWEQAQRHLDAAYQVLEGAATGSAGAP